MLFHRELKEINLKMVKEERSRWISCFISVITSLINRVKELEEENKRLRCRLNTDSRNSSKPPSSDGFKKAARSNEKNQRKKSDRKVGGQDGHKGSKLRRAENPDEIILDKLCNCLHCKGDISDTKVMGIERRQVFDIPPLSIYVTEYQREIKRCIYCGKISKSNFPDGLAQEARKSYYTVCAEQRVYP